MELIRWRSLGRKDWIMSNNTEEQITQNVLDSMAQAPNPRLKKVMNSLVSHLHDFIREVELTQEEWALGIQFLTRTGHMCDDKRQEFILLSDITGVTMLVDAINHRLSDGATESTIFGPFYREGAQELPMGATISKDGRGEPVVVMGRVLSTDGSHTPAHLSRWFCAGHNAPVRQGRCISRLGRCLWHEGFSRRRFYPA